MRSARWAGLAGAIKLRAGLGRGFSGPEGVFVPESRRVAGAGATVQAQLWYRDPLNTSNQTTSLSNALEFSVNP